jgi:PadR family transcriptional regulator PadR
VASFLSSQAYRVDTFVPLHGVWQIIAVDPEINPHLTIYLVLLYIVYRGNVIVRTERHLTQTEYWQSLNRKSLLRFFLFSALAQKPMHGYQLADAISICCDGVRPTDAMIYPTLKELESNGYITCETKATGARKRNVCSLTSKGMEAYRAAAQAWSRALPQIESAVHNARVMECCAVEYEVQEIALEEVTK